MDAFIVSSILAVLLVTLIGLTEIRHKRRQNVVTQETQEMVKKAAVVASRVYERKHNRRSTILTQTFPELFEPDDKTKSSVA